MEIESKLLHLKVRESRRRTAVPSGVSADVFIDSLIFEQTSSSRSILASGLYRPSDWLSRNTNHRLTRASSRNVWNPVLNYCKGGKRGSTGCVAVTCSLIAEAYPSWKANPVVYHAAAAESDNFLPVRVLPSPFEQHVLQRDVYHLGKHCRYMCHCWTWNKSARFGVYLYCMAYPLT